MRSSPQTTAPVASAFLTGFAGLAVWAAHQFEITNPEWSLILLTVLLVGYLLVEIRRVSNVHRTRWLLNPAVMCSVMTFMLGFGVTNFIYFLPYEQLAGTGVPPGVTYWMVNLLALVLLGAIAMWLAYWSPLAVELGRNFQCSRFLDRMLRWDWSFSARRDSDSGDCQPRQPSDRHPPWRLWLQFRRRQTLGIGRGHSIPEFD